MAFLLLFFVTSALMGGDVYVVRCKDRSCGFQADFEFGGGKEFDQVQGFCSSCRKFVKRSWPHHDPDQHPTPIKYVGSMKLEANRSIYPCPDCSGCFQNVCKPRALKAEICPRCQVSHLAYSLKKRRG